MAKTQAQRGREYRQRKKDLGDYNLNVYVSRHERMIMEKYSNQFGESYSEVTSRALRLLHQMFMLGPKGDNIEDKYFSLGPPKDPTAKHTRKTEKPVRHIRIQ